MGPSRKDQTTIMFLELSFPSTPVSVVGIVLEDKTSDFIIVKMRDSWDTLLPPEDAEVLSAFQDHFNTMIGEKNGAQLLEMLKSGSNALTVSQEYSINRPENVETYCCSVLELLSLS